MALLNRMKSVVPTVLILIILSACEKDPVTLGSGLVGGEPFSLGQATFDIFAENKNIEAVRTNKLPSYQLGTFNDPTYGRTEAKITSQVRLSRENPTFGDDSAANETVDENETVESVVLYIPFLTNNVDSDQDGLIDGLDEDPADANSDTDGDGLTDNQERVRGTDPLNRDTDGDGIDDDVDDDFVANNFALRRELEGIFGSVTDSTMPFTIRVQRSDFFLRDLDPATNFQEAQEYFSNQDFSGFATEQISIDTMVTVSDRQILDQVEDDPETEEDESLQFERVEPGIRVPLDPAFFQRNILDKEGDAELLNQANFASFLRGMHFTLEPASGADFMMLFDLKDANIMISYTYVNDDEEKTGEYQLNFLTPQTTAQGQQIGVNGNAVNTFENEAYPPEIEDAFASENQAERIYLKGGAGSFAQINLFDEANGRETIARIKANNWIVNEANLTFYVDGGTNGELPERLYLFNLENGNPVIGRNDDIVQGNSLESYPFYDGRLQGSAADGTLRYSVKITDYLNDLVVRDAENSTLGLTLTPDITIFSTSNAMLQGGAQVDLPVAATLSPLGVVLFGSDVSGENADKKVDLEIFYTEAN